MEGYTKLKGAEIAASIVWSTDPRTRLLFVCLLIAADEHGFLNWPGTTNVRMIEDFGLGKDGCVDAMERLIDMGIVRLEPSGVWLTEPNKYRDKQTKKQAKAADRVRKHRERKDSGERLEPVTKKAKPVTKKAKPVTKKTKPVTKGVTRSRREPVTVLRDGTYEGSSSASGIVTRTISTNSTSSTNNSTSTSSSPRVTRYARPNGVSEQVWEDYRKLRQTKKAPITKTSMNMVINEARNARISLEEALVNCISYGWTGFKADWINRRDFKSRKPAPKAASHESGEIDF